MSDFLKIENVGFGVLGMDGYPRLQNEETILQNFQAQKLAILDQNHSDIVRYVGADYVVSIGDAMVTDLVGIVLGIKTADCVCALLASIDGNVIGAVHLGWKGAGSDLLQNTVALMRQLSNSEICAFIAPCIRQKSYEVQHDFFEDFTAIKPKSKQFFLQESGKLFFDLPGFVKYEMQYLGIKNIVDNHEDTYGSDLYFSYRYAKHQGIDEKRRNLSCIVKI